MSSQFVKKHRIQCVWWPHQRQVHQSGGETSLYIYRMSNQQFVLQVTRLLSAYLEKYSLSPVFTEEEVEHYLTPVEDVVDSYVVESAGQPVISLFVFGSNFSPAWLLLGICH